jgi:hypothetical protein
LFIKISLEFRFQQRFCYPYWAHTVCQALNRQVHWHCLSTGCNFAVLPPPRGSHQLRDRDMSFCLLILPSQRPWPAQSHSLSSLLSIISPSLLCGGSPSCERREALTSTQPFGEYHFSININVSKSRTKL